MNVIKFVISFINYKRTLNNAKLKWRQKNKNNFTNISDLTPNVVTIGKYTYGTINLRYFETKDESLYIGNFCSIAEGVTFLTGVKHHLDTFSTYPFTNYIETEFRDNIRFKGKIVVNDDVWIGNGATILSGVEIGQGAVIGAKSVVAKNVPPYSIFVGNKVIKKISV